MKKVTLELDGVWVLKHREDEKLPVALIKSELQKIPSLKIAESTFTSISLFFNNDEIEEATVTEKIKEIFTCLYPEGGVTDVLSLTFEDYSEEQEIEDIVRNEEKIKELEERRKAVLESKRISEPILDSDFSAAEKVLASIEQLVGAEEYKSLAKEIARVAPEIRSRNTYEVFYNRCYLFSIGDGCGLTTYLNLLAKLISATGLRKMNSRPVWEGRLGPYRESMESFESVIEVLRNGDSDKVKILCVDISEWINKTDSRFFKRFLRLVEKVTDEFIVVFRVPFVDKDILACIKNSLNDLLSVRAVSFPPLSQNEIKAFADKELNKYGFTATKTSWKFFFRRITEEKSDGKFYGHNTVKKVVHELIYYKQLSNTKSNKPNTVINGNDMKALCGTIIDDGLSGTEQLNRLVGNELIKKKIEEIIAQIELSVKEDSAERPCIHMRFVGNPGTGKTTVARIIGKVLKERGVLRIGNFYEYSGRDFCGRYIGETAPKTASICRDAYGSVLFIDEAYSLYRGDDNDRDFGREAIDTLIAEMENHRTDFVVIMAGYTDDMNKLMNGNNGLKSRMPYTIEFPNFTREQLYEIYASMVTSKFKHDDKILEAARIYFTSLSDEIITSKEFSNARFVRNLFERTWAKAAMRRQLNGKGEILLTKDDFDRASSEKDFSFNIQKKTVIGF